MGVRIQISSKRVASDFSELLASVAYGSHERVKLAPGSLCYRG